MSRRPLYPRATQAPHPGDLSQPTEAAVLWLCDRACEHAFRAWQTKTGGRGVLEDFTGAAFVAVVEARNSHDGRAGFNSWATTCFRFAILDELRRQGFLTRGRWERLRDLEERQARGETLTPAELAEFDLKGHEKRLLSLDDPAGDGAADDSDDLTIADQVPDPAPGPEELVVGKRDFTPLYDAIRDTKLSARERGALVGVLEGRFYADLAQEWGCSVSWVETIYTRALAKVRRTLFERGIEDL
jgi:RNA polymerase sigma factor (sigma-70 family)